MNFKFLGIKLPCMWSLVKYNFPSQTWAHSPHTLGSLSPNKFSGSIIAVTRIIT